MRLIQKIPLVILSLLLLGCASFIVFYQNSDYIFVGLDGNYMLDNVEKAFSGLEPKPGFTWNPLQGMFEIEFGFNPWFSPGYIVPFLVMGMPSDLNEIYQSLVYTTHLLVYCASIYFLGRTFELSQFSCILGGWLGFLLLFPIWGNSFIYPMYTLQPNHSSSVSLYLFSVCCFFRLGRSTDSLNLVHIILLLLMQSLVVYENPGTLIFAFIFIIIAFSLISLIKSKGEILWKGSAVLLMLALFFGSGQFEYVLGYFQYTVPYLLKSSLTNPSASWYFVSTLFHQESHGFAGPVFLCCAVGALVFFSLKADKLPRVLARLILLVFLLNFVLGSLVVKEIVKWVGPAALYAELLLFPFLFLFSMQAVYRLASLLGSHTMNVAALVESKLSVFGEDATLKLFIITISLVVVLSATVLIRFSEPRQIIYRYPQTETKITHHLSNEIGIRQEGAMVGRVISLWQRNEKNSVSWGELHTNDGNRARAFGNDFSTVGLWNHNIPTVFAYSPLISPMLYKYLTSMFAYDRDAQIRNVAVMRKISLNGLKIAGVTHVLTDTKIGKPYEFVMSEKISSDSEVILYKVPEVHIGLSARKGGILYASNLDESISLIDRLDFDPDQSTILYEEDRGSFDTEALSDVSDLEVVFKGKKLEISAGSSGEALLVLPIIFSNCIRVEDFSSERGRVRLYRTNGVFTGIHFENELKITLEYFIGPFSNSRCRTKDVEDFRSLVD